MKTKLFYSLILTIGILMLTLTSCSSPKKSEDILYVNSEMNTLARKAVISLVNNDFQTVVDAFDLTLTDLLSTDVLKSSWTEIVLKLGAHVEHQSLVGQVQGEYFVAVVTEKYELGNLIVTISYNAEKQIAGLYTTYTLSAVDNNVFTEEPVTVMAENTMPLDGFLTLPKNVNKPPVVLLVHGSGATDKNETLFENTPFKDIAHGLAQHGIATLRYDKRYFIYPQRAAELGVNLTLEDEVLDDVSAAIELLRQDNRVDSSAIYVLGHSLGGMLTPAIAVENKDLGGIISMAGTLRPLYEISYDQNKVSEKAVLHGDYDDQTIASVKMGMLQVEKDIEILRGDISALPNDQLLLGLPVGYQKSLKKYTGMNFIDDVHIPILVLQGKADFQVYVDSDFLLWEETLNGRENSVLKLYENLNHMMMETNGKQDLSEYQPKGVVHQDVIDDITEFILK